MPVPPPARSLMDFPSRAGPVSLETFAPAGTDTCGAWERGGGAPHTHPPRGVTAPGATPRSATGTGTGLRLLFRGVTTKCR